MILESKSFYWSIYSGLEETLEGEILVGVLVLEHPSPTGFRHSIAASLPEMPVSPIPRWIKHSIFFLSLTIPLLIYDLSIQFSGFSSIHNDATVMTVKFQDIFLLQNKPISCTFLILTCPRPWQPLICFLSLYLPVLGVSHNMWPLVTDSFQLVLCFQGSSIL